MTIRRLLFFGIILCCVTTPLPRAHAQSDFWVYLFNHNNQTFLRMNADSSTSPFSIQMPAEFAAVPYRPQAYSPDGSHLALCLDPDSDPFTPNPLTLLIFEIPSGELILQTNTGPGMYCDVTAAGWAPDNRTFAFGVLYKMLDDSNGPAWEVRVLEVPSGTVAQVMTSLDAPITGLGLDFSDYFPSVRYFVPGQMVAFLTSPFGVGGPLYGDGVVWNLTDNTIQLNDIYGQPDIEILGGEVMWLDENPAFAALNPVGDGVVFNEVMFSDKAGTSHPLYVDRGFFICGAKYVDGGRRIAILTCSFDYMQYIWRYVDRTGGGNTLPIEDACNFSPTSLVGTPDGYLVLKCAGGGAQLERHIFTTNTVPVVTRIWFDPSDNWSIAAQPLDGANAGSGWPNAAPQ